MEEKWGLWMKKYGLDEDIDYNRKEEIKKVYEKFENEIKKNYLNSSNLNLLNPFNYLSYNDYQSAYSQDSYSCFLAGYMEGIEDLKNIKKDEDKDKLKKKVFKISEENDDIITYNVCQNDIKDKLNNYKNI